MEVGRQLHIPGLLTPGERALSTHLFGDLVGPKGSSNTWEGEELSYPCRKQKRSFSVTQLVVLSLHRLSCRYHLASCGYKMYLELQTKLKKTSTLQQKAVTAYV
jgi:hypothetical protein